MKNIHLLPTDKPSRIYFIKSNNKLGITSNNPEFTENFGSGTQNQNIYITNDEEIKNGEYGICLNLVREGFKSNQAVFKMDSEQRQAMEGLGGQKKAEVLKVVLTKDQDLIKDGVQAIDDDFLEWFVKNPSCEEVKVEGHIYKGQDETEYKIIIPKEEPKQELERGITITHKQETLEEVAQKYAELSYYGDEVDAFVRGVKWQAERMYSKEDLDAFRKFMIQEQNFSKSCLDLFIKQFKKK